MTAAEDTKHQVGIKQARRRAQWELGDGAWADVIVGAYLNPATDAEALKRREQDA